MNTKNKLTHGGARANAGRPENQPVLMHSPGSANPLEFLREVMNDQGLDMRVRIDAAKALMPYLHAKHGELGKKEIQDAEAKQVSTGKYAASKPPRLVSKQD